MVYHSTRNHAIEINNMANTISAVHDGKFELSAGSH